MLNFFWQLIVGLIVGVLARLIMPGKEGFPPGATGWILTALLGVAGAFIGSIIGGALWGGENYAAGWIMSILGALLLLFIVKLVFGRSTTV